MPMTWYDAAKDNERNAEAHAAGRDVPVGQKPDMVWRLDDGTALGRWRVCVEQPEGTPPDKRTWAVYDLRRGGDGTRTVKPITVVSGIKSWRVAILAASACAASRPLRTTLAGLRMLKMTAACLRALPEVVREEWGQR
jgi:hypothetical protein